MKRRDDNDSTDPGTGSGERHRPLSVHPQSGVVPFRGLQRDRMQRREEPPADSPLPERYEVRQGGDGNYLRCQEAPALAVHFDRGFAFTKAEARKLGERVILLDGAGQFEPLADDNRQLYNLDHHQGCLRAVTLATCEQALILVLKGLELDRGDWTIYANEPDLDTLFAVWVVLNHRRVRELSPEARDAIVPLLRLEGAIDANGFEIAEFCGLPQEMLPAVRAKLDRLHERELELKRNDEWAGIDLAAYAREMLSEIDTLVYTPGDFTDFARVEKEYGHVEVGQDRVAVICRDSSGIYEVEKRLKAHWGERLGIVALEKHRGHYTLRRAAALSGIDLDTAYYKLNLLDPNVDGRPPEKRWGGSDDIGGSPRPGGTALNPREIGEILWLAFRRPGRWSRLQHVGLAVLLSLGLALAGALGVLFYHAFVGVPVTLRGEAARLAGLALLVAGGAGVFTGQFARRRSWLLGWRRPAGRDWFALLPFAVLGAAGGGAWVQPHPGWGAEQVALAMGALLLWALAVETWFRSLVHGVLIFDFRVQLPAGRWFISLPVLMAAVLFMLISLTGWWFGLAMVPATAGPLVFEPWAQALLVAGSALAAGLALGMIRERSLSLWPGVAALAAGWILRLLLDLRLAVG